MSRSGKTLSRAVLAGGILVAACAMAGALDPTNAPGPTMHTLEEIYEKVENLVPQDLQQLSATTTVVEAGNYAATTLMQVDTDLATTNIRSGVTIFGITGDPNVVNTSSGDADADDLLTGKKAWVDGNEVTGTIGTQSLSPAIDAVAAGYYEATTLSAVDADLATANIKSGVMIFGVAGDANVVDTSSGDAIVSDILTGKKAWVDGGEVTGNVPAGDNVAGADGALVIAIPDGLYSGSKAATASDTDLVPGNIKAGANVFGVMGRTEVVDTSSGDALASDIFSGKKAWVDGAEVTGSMPDRGAVTITPGTMQQAIQEGYHNGSGYVEGDAGLLTGNIRAGTNIFGVAGKTEVVDTTSGDAVAGDILMNKKAWVDGAEITGTRTPAPVPETGQTNSWATGDDGDLQRGVAWPSPRFTDNNNGTVTDHLTGLIWLKNANAFGERYWGEALTDCNTLNSGEHGLSDGSVEGDWRLPNMQEMISLIDYGQHDPALPTVHSFTNTLSEYYWTSTADARLEIYAWTVDTDDGQVDGSRKTSDTEYVWPVRGGQ